MTESQLTNKLEMVFKELDETVSQIKEKYDPETYENKLNKLNEKFQALESKLNQEPEITHIEESLNELRQRSKELESQLSNLEAIIKEVKKPNETINDEIFILEKKVKTATDAIYSKLNYEVERLDKKENSIKPEINIERLIKLEDENKAAANTILNLNDETKRINSKMENINGTNIYKWLTIVSFVLLLLLSSFFYYWCCSQVKALKDEISFLKTQIVGVKPPNTTPEPVPPPITTATTKPKNENNIQPKTNMEYVEFAIKYKKEYLEMLKQKLCSYKIEVHIGNQKKYIMPIEFLHNINIGMYDNYELIYVGDSGNCIPGVMFKRKE